MGRNNKSYHKDLKQQIYEKFTTMLKNSEGRSKTADKKNNCTQNFIYSYNTYKSYWKHAKYFANYINEYHPECTTLKAAKKYINEWLQFRVLCDKANIHYLPPHQVRFSEATLLAIEGADLQIIQFHMGHIGPDMSLYYVRGAQKELPTAGPKLA